MQIGEPARRAGVSARALRYYEQRGLLSPARAANGHREYDELDLIHARNIRDLLDLGLITEDIRGHLEQGCLDRPLQETPHCAAEPTTVRARPAHLDERIHRLQRLRDRLARHGEEVRRAVAAAPSLGVLPALRVLAGPAVLPALAAWAINPPLQAMMYGLARNAAAEAMALATAALFAGAALGGALGGMPLDR